MLYDTGSGGDRAYFRARSNTATRGARLRHNQPPVTARQDFPRSDRGLPQDILA